MMQKGGDNAYGKIIYVSNCHQQLGNDELAEYPRRTLREGDFSSVFLLSTDNCLKF